MRLNPFAARHRGSHHPPCPLGLLEPRREEACACTWVTACSVCYGAGFCYCLYRAEDIAREQAEAQARRDEEAEWMSWQVFTADDCDEALERDRARGHEIREQRADTDRRR